LNKAKGYRNIEIYHGGRDYIERLREKAVHICNHQKNTFDNMGVAHPTFLLLERLIL
jgi:hypothetical protein